MCRILISSHVWDDLKPRLVSEIDTLVVAVREVLKAAPRLEAEELDTAQREALRAQRSALLGLQRDGIISDEVFNELAAEIDTELASETLPIPPPVQQN
jgi:hypothetical protein